MDDMGTCARAVRHRATILPGAGPYPGGFCDGGSSAAARTRCWSYLPGMYHRQWVEDRQAAHLCLYSIQPVGQAPAHIVSVTVVSGASQPGMRPSTVGRCARRTNLRGEHAADRNAPGGHFPNITRQPGAVRKCQSGASRRCEPTGKRSALPAWAQKMIADLRGEAAANRKRCRMSANKPKKSGWQISRSGKNCDAACGGGSPHSTGRTPAIRRWADRIREQIDVEAKAWPSEVQALRPATDDVAALMEFQGGRASWLQNWQPPPTPPGTGKTPTPAGRGRADQEKARKEFERRAIRSF